MFDLFIGIDYSGAQAPTSRLSRLQVYTVRAGSEEVERWTSPTRSDNGQRVNWTRREIAARLRDEALTGRRFLAGLDHGFSFPQTYFQRYALASWPEFLEDFVSHWPTHLDHMHVDCVRDGHAHGRGEAPSPGQRVGDATEFRLTERWTSSAKSVFQLDGRGTVGKSTHAGIPLLKWLRDELGERVHFWPFDGWSPPADKPVVAEVYPSIFRNRYPREERTADEQDAYATARWMADMAARGALAAYFAPPLTAEEKSRALLEGWILGVR
jgi:hypothetical protein